MILAPEAPLKKETSTEIIFAHRFFVGWFYLCIGAGIIFIGLKQGFEKIINYIICIGMGSFGSTIIIVGFLGILKRFEISINLLSRTYVVRKGYWPRISIKKGSLSDLNGLILNTRIDSGAANSSVLVWTISLEFKNSNKPVSIMEYLKEAEAYQRLESLAKKINLPIHDRTIKNEFVMPIGGQE